MEITEKPLVSVDESLVAKIDQIKETTKRSINEIFILGIEEA